jgi:hypothetical protein
MVVKTTAFNPKIENMAISNYVISFHFSKNEKAKLSISPFLRPQNQIENLIKIKKRLKQCLAW